MPSSAVYLGSSYLTSVPMFPPVENEDSHVCSFTVVRIKCINIKCSEHGLNDNECPPVLVPASSFEKDVFRIAEQWTRTHHEPNSKGI